ncbi:hypothetical protein BV898_00180 [Hypsibius exemplaris]|uniref:Uncharacterized protein n=1 Tax=Hypsibius exemplaris TaxID=2072580 RepID=A0A1W0XEY7_HYPEX|nr:hypothetical protein BV898_00180 [Hypsibius exemplaris]
MTKKRTLYCLATTSILCALIPLVWTTNRYYGTYIVYGTGDTIINTAQAHSGPEHGKRRWNVECLDGEAVIGIHDLQDDFQKLVNVWCKFMFPFKQYTNGLYPYYPDCFVRNYTFQFHCYSPKYHEVSVNSFITGFWDNDAQFFNFRRVVDDQNPYKCCKTPPNYYVDYQSCYYMPAKDQYGEYYDATTIILLYCASGYAMTGLAKKISPFSMDYHVEWIQCCRIGFGAQPVFKPPRHSYSYGSYANSSYPNRPPAGYASQYSGQNLGPRGLKREGGDIYAGGQSQTDKAASYTGGFYGAHRSLDDEDDTILRTSLHETGSM